jgi:hypothetical protein
MNWFKRMVGRWAYEYRDTPDDVANECYPSPKLGRGMNTVSTGEVNSDPTLHFKIYNAIGGKVVEFSRYDKKSDRHHHDIYIIGKNEDFGEKIAKIAMLETLKD